MKVRLYRPFLGCRFHCGPAGFDANTSLSSIRTKEPGGIGEPLYQDVVTAISENSPAHFAATRGLSAAAMDSVRKSSRRRWSRAVFDQLRNAAPKKHFTVGIVDDAYSLSLPIDPTFTTEPDIQVRAVFWGWERMARSARNKNSIKIIGEETPQLCPGLLRLRFEEVRGDNGLAPAFWP